LHHAIYGPEEGQGEWGRMVAMTRDHLHHAIYGPEEGQGEWGRMVAMTRETQMMWDAGDLRHDFNT